MVQEKRLSRRERDKLRQRQEILTVALELFSMKGYHNVSMNEIAEKSEFAVGTLYNFFSNKEDIYKSIMIDISNKFHSALINSLNEDKDEIEKLRNYVNTKGRIFMSNAPAVHLYHSETLGAICNAKTGFYAEIRKQYDQVQLQVSAVIKRGIQKKLFNSIADPYLLAVALDGAINDFLFLWLEDSAKNPYPEDPHVILNIFFKGLLAAPPQS